MYCSKCGKKLPDNAKFCSGCGNKIKQLVKEEKLEVKEEPKVEEKKEEIKEEVKEEIVEKETVKEDKKVEEKPEVEEKKEVEEKPEVKEEPKVEETPKVEPTPVPTPVVSTPVVKPKKKMSTINIILIIGIAFISLVILSCVGVFVLQGNQERVVMIYMVGSNLESKSGLATRDLSDLDYEKLKQNHTKVILIAGGTTSWKNSYIDVNETSIYSLESTGFEKIDARPRTNMGTIDNLSYFLNYVHDHYRASKYDFIYWNHGGAVDGSEYDDLTGDHLMLIEMGKAFENSKFKGNKKLEVISFRTCLNSTIEVANIYKNYAKYLVASEEVTIGSQADSAIRFLNDVTLNDSPVEYGKKQIQTYKEVVSNTCNYSSFTNKDENYCVDSTYSITDLSKIDNLKSKLNDFASDLNKNVQSKYREFSKLRSNMKQYASDEPAYDMIDLYDFTETFDKYSKNGKAVRDALEEAVVYNWTNTNYSHGLSIYFPYNNKVFLSSYSDISTSDNYTSFINSFYNIKSGIKVSSYSDFSESDGIKFSDKKSKKKKEKVKEKETDVELELTEEQIKNMTKASYLVFADTKDGYYQILYAGKDVKVDGNKLKASIKDRMLRLTDSEYDDDDTWLLAVEDKVEDDYVEIKTYVYLSNSSAVFGSKTLPSTAIIRIDKEHPNGYIKALYTNFDGKSDSENSNSFSVFAPAGTKLTDYNFISVLSSRYKLLDENGNYNPNWTETSDHVIQGKVFRTNMVKFKKEDFKSDYDYYVVFRIYDIANNEYSSKPIKISK